MRLFNDFKEYIRDNDYEIDKINEYSVRGIKDKLKIHLFKERFYDNQYGFYVNDNERKIFDVSMIRDGEKYSLDCEVDNKEFDSIFDIINYVKDKIEIEI